MVPKTFIIVATLIGMAPAQAQQPTAQITPWHVSTIFTFTDEQPGSPIASGVDVTVVPAGYNAVIEHASARCSAPPQLAILYGEVVLSSNPSNPGQSGTAGPAPQPDTANHPFLFQTTYSGSSNVYAASQQMTLRVSPPNGRIRFIGDFLNLTESQPLMISCLVSISGYLQKQ